MYRASIIKSIQYGTIAIANLSTSNTATLGTAVVVANAVVKHLGTKNTNSNDLSTSEAGLVLTNTTTVTASRIGTTNACTVSFVVIEYVSGILRSNQPFTVTINGGTSATATITAVTVAKTEVVWQGSTWASADAVGENAIGELTLTNTTTVTGSRTGTGANNLVLYGTAVEFK